MKKLFNTKNLTDTAVNLIVGGGANVAMDYAVSEVEALKSLSADTVNYIKIGVGVLAGTMTGNKYLRAAADGLATVGASQLISGLISGTTAGDGGNGGGANGLPAHMVGALRLGNGRFRKNGDRRISGVAAAPNFMGK